MFFKIGILKNFANFPCNFIKKRLQRRYFPVKFGQFLRTPFFYRTPPVAAPVHHKWSTKGPFWSLFHHHLSWIISLHFPKIHRSVLRKIAIDLLHFWGIYDVNLWEKVSAEARLIHAEQTSLYNFIVLRKKNRHSWRLNNSSKTF